MTESGDRLRKARLRAGFTLASSFAHQYNINATTYRAHEAGTRGLRPPVAEKYAECLRRASPALKGVTSAWLILGGPQPFNDDTPIPKNRNDFGGRAAVSPHSTRTLPELPLRSEMPLDVEVHGTAAGNRDKGAFQIEQTVIDRVRRPPGIMGAPDVYGLYVEGESMLPAFRPGALVFVSERRPVRVGDHVIVQVQENEHDTIESYLKEFVKRDDQWVVLKQYNPDSRMKLKASTVIAVHRILSLNDLFGI